MFFAGTVAGRQAERERSRRLFDNIAMQKLLAFPLRRRIGAIDQDGTVGLAKNRPSYQIADWEASAAAKRSSNRTEA